MRKQSYAEIIYINELMVNGFKNYTEQMAKRGISEEFTGKMLQVGEVALKLNDEQESLKAKLKMTTAELEKLLTELLRMQSEIKKTVKLALPQESWVAFGIKDKR